jgi:UDP-N-acetylglucosamine 2-epimerase (non-hydrolysing)
VSFTVLHVAGARPNFLKVAPVLRAMEARGGLRSFLVHTGRHYHATMADAFFLLVG